MAQLLKNNAYGVLASGITDSAASMTLADASRFDTPTGGDYYLATLIGFGGNGAENAWEIVRVTEKASNTLTIVRAQEGTAAVAWPAATQVQLRMTAGTMATKADLASPTFTGTVAGITKSMVGLGSVDNTADTAKPVSTAQQTALNLKANLASPALTGTPTAPTATAGTSTTQLATTAYVNAEIAADAAPLSHVGAGGAAHANVVAAGAAGFMTGADKTKLDGIAAGAQANTVTSVAAKTGAVVLVKADVGLGNVDNTSDAGKPISTATQTAINAKVAASGGTASGLTLNDGYTEEVFAVTGTTPALSPTNGSIQTWVLSGNSTPTAGTWASGQSMTLMVDDGSAYTINWASMSITWKTGGGTAPTLLTAGYTVIELANVGVTIYGWLAGDA